MTLTNRELREHDQKVIEAFRALSVEERYLALKKAGVLTKDGGIRYPDRLLGTVTHDGQTYDLDFFGLDENSAVISGPIPKDIPRRIPEVAAFPATSPQEAFGLLSDWLQKNWPEAAVFWCHLSQGSNPVT